MAKYEIVRVTWELREECPQHHRHLREVYVCRVDAGDGLLAPVAVHHFAALVRMERHGDTFSLAPGDAVDPSAPEPARFVPCRCGRGYVIEPGDRAQEELRSAEDETMNTRQPPNAASFAALSSWASRSPLSTRLQ